MGRNRLLGPRRRRGGACAVNSERSGEFCRADSFRPVGNQIGAPAQPAAWGAAKMLEFEVAAALRDQIIKLRGEGK